MAKYRQNLPQLANRTFLSDGGMETTLIFHEGLDLPHFASFTLVATPEGRQKLKDYYVRYLTIARRGGTGFILDTPTWRANPDWGMLLGYGPEALRAVNESSIELLLDLRKEFETAETPCVISGAIGPRGDGYKAGNMDANEAEAYHAAQIESFARTEADMVAAYTLTNFHEAIGVARAAKAHAMPCMISFTVETDGKLVTGMALGEAIDRVDDATDGAPAYYMINCAHPTHFMQALKKGERWLDRVYGVKANASAKSHAELDESETLDAGDPDDLGRRYSGLRASFPTMRILGGCCGTDHRHIAAICEACVPQAA
ncbi:MULTISPECIES: homocysteine S-methyltransferase family protein [unclassified Mesorhizobium]|uniref:homocysteine S-methyltransferase family protein n=1 Tax=unclassified Mesorhizobium TaxID=325217 RepID=UPI000FD4A219|nr:MULTISPECIES: homocysteine S-methyltransferase family protein [unclassified Mesorhizobium]RVB79970.1 homocysteine methyltransferase [Mesorhizobium sp. M6A.T.Cr.TU.014.01.1.1]RWP81943.1 MAG: homocysteine methyltransferase [Mesorhizobium sp.]RWQ08611.1 MAG: homocysteine methyltransferase [Mesorhizobium sp.]RWQ12197.1 MAG: homocysteine methyltransferase [Mesorhizobium sp.]